MNNMKKVLLAVLMAAIVMLGQLGCDKKNEEHPSGEHPSKEDANKEHPASEHPAGEHPK